jgi:hypothetical protein
LLPAQPANNATMSRLKRTLFTEKLRGGKGNAKEPAIE